MAAVAVLGAAPVGGQEKPAPSAEQLAGITSRGRRLAAYEAAAWHGSDALLALHPDTTLLRRYIARETPAGWTVVFGRLTPDGRAFGIAYEAWPDSAAPSGYAARAVRPVVADTGFYYRAARALDVAERDFGYPSRPYNSAVLPADRGEWWVYLVPAPQRAGVWPLGGNVRYLVSADGATVREKRRLHNAIIEMGPPPPGIVRGMHTVLLDSLPTDTDVFYVLTRRPRLSELVATKLGMFLIEADGSMSFAGSFPQRTDSGRGPPRS